jgi:uncharacterized membrane protein
MSVAFVYPQLLWLLLLAPLTGWLALSGPRRPTPRRFWAGLALRLALLTSIVLALAGIQLRLRADSLTAVFLLDVSDSVPQAERAYGEQAVRAAIESMPVGDQAAVVVFGQDALVERLPSEEKRLPGLTSVPVTYRTDIASALQLGLALFPAEGAKRLVLLSDGRENLGQALEQVKLAAANRVELLYVPLRGPQGQVEVLLEALEAPADVRQGQEFDLTAVVNSSAAVEATLRVFGDGQLLNSQELRLQPGNNRFRVPVEADQTGFRRFSAQILPEADTRLQNNEAAAFTVVHGPPRLLVVEGSPGEADNLRQALASAEMEVTVLPPSGLPTALAELAAYEAVVLVDVPASALPAGAQDALQVYVRDLGKGLVMIGGQNGFGAGGYLRTPLEESLPVYMDVRARDLSANLALVLVVDKSGSMGRCHCDDPNLNQSYTRREVGQPKVDIAKEAVMRAASALGSQDYLGVVAFDDTASWAVEVSKFVDFASLERSIGGIQAHGQTNVYAGLDAAYEALKGAQARRKHIILLTDGWSRSGNFQQLAQEMNAAGITLSIVAAGGGSAEYLKQMAVDGGGRYYPAENILDVPDFFLKETVKAVGQYVIEEPFYPLPSLPGPVLRGLEAASLPALLGYNGTSPKNTARIDLATSRGDPLLATWQYGLGRSAAWTSDLKGQWAREWIGWEGYPRFVAQLVGWVLPAPQVEGLAAQVSLVEGRALIRLQATDSSGAPRNFLEAQATLIGPDLKTQTAPLEQVGAGSYQVILDINEAGTYLVRLGANEGSQSLGQQTLGLVVPYSPEYRAGGTNLGLLQALAAATGGAELLEPAAAFVHNLPITEYAREIWRPLLLLVALLFPLDIALRRVMLSPADMRSAVQWLRQRLPARRGGGAEGARLLGQLFQARERARQRTRQVGVPEPERAAPGSVAPSTSPPQPAHPAERRAPAESVETAPEAPKVSTADTLARLRDAKKRARRGE